MKRFTTIHDISIMLGMESITYPGDPEYSLDFVESLKSGNSCNLSKLEMSSHAGTHLDFPLHFLPGAKSSEQFPIETFILPALVAEITNENAVMPSELSSLPIGPGDAILFKTKNSSSGRSRAGTFSEEYVHVSAEAARFCMEKNVKLVGIDYITIDQFKNEKHPAHVILLKENILILEGITLHDVPPGRYTLICLPLKVFGAEGVPARAILVK
ncbi:MAG: cyclase family protein [Candidatus Helarchaeota archaeon]